MSRKTAKHLPPRTVITTLAAFALSVFAILLWGRIKLVAGVPRTAYAVPKNAQQPAPPKPQAPPVAEQPRDSGAD